jgi:hypothetical protein
LDFKVMQGVTTVVIGSCGSGVAPVTPDYRQHYEVFLSSVLGPATDFSWSTTAEFYAALEKAGPSLNVAPWRRTACCASRHGHGEPPPSAEQMERMKELLEEAWRQAPSASRPASSTHRACSPQRELIGCAGWWLVTAASTPATSAARPLLEAVERPFASA